MAIFRRHEEAEAVRNAWVSKEKEKKKKSNLRILTLFLKKALAIKEKEKIGLEANSWSDQVGE